MTLPATVAQDCIEEIRKVMERHGVRLTEVALDRLRIEIEYEVEEKMR